VKRNNLGLQQAISETVSLFLCLAYLRV